jgi:hypothetical protein
MTIRTPFARGRIAAALALATLALVGAGTPGAAAEPHPDHQPTYEVTADLDGRATPSRGEEAIVEEDFVRDGQEVRVICQKRGDSLYGSRIWDLVPNGNDTLFVPDRYIRTGTDGPSAEIGSCTASDLDEVTAPPSPYPPTHP